MKKEKVYMPADNVMKNAKLYATLLDWVVSGMASRATKYMSKTHVIRATRTRYGGRFNRGNIEITLSIGKPNFAEREYIKNVLFKEKFPMKGVVVKLYNPKPKKLKRKSSKN